MSRLRTEGTLSRWLQAGGGTDADSDGGEWRRPVLECGLLLTLMVAVGTFVVSSHWTSIWMDREFTGWVARISRPTSMSVAGYDLINGSKIGDTCICAFARIGRGVVELHSGADMLEPGPRSKLVQTAIDKLRATLAAAG